MTKEGYEPLEFKVGVARSKTAGINKTLRRLEGTLIVSSDPYPEGAEVYIDDDYKGEVPATILLPAGEHSVKIQTDYKIGTWWVTVVDRKTVTTKIPMGERLSAEGIQSKHTISFRISSNVISSANMFRTSYTVTRSPLIHGFTDLFPGDTVIYFL